MTYLFAFALIVLSIVSFSVSSVDAFFGTSVVPATANGVAVNVEGAGENFSGATYTATYKIYSPSNQAVSFPIQTQTNRCDEPNGDLNSQYGACSEDEVLGNATIDLNSSNNYSQNVTLSVTQVDNKPCGSFQTDIWFMDSGSPRFILGSLHYTGKHMSECPSASPSPSPSPSTIQCPVGKMEKVVDSTIICVAQEQNQNQNQTQNNDQNQNVNQNVVATGGNSSSNSSSSSHTNVTINNPVTTKEVIKEVKVSTPQVVMQTKGDVKELPKTGLPLAALALGGLMPAGFGIKRFMKKDQVEETANSIWTEKQLNS